MPPDQRLPLLLKGGMDPEKDLENIKLIFKVHLISIACSCSLQLHVPVSGKALQEPDLDRNSLCVRLCYTPCAASACSAART